MSVETPPGEGTRPTSSRVRAAALNALQTELHGAVILELCAGSGAVGIEMLSRGARGVVFVEWNKAALVALRRNIEQVRERAAKQGIEISPLEVCGESAQDAVRALVKSETSFEICWFDPPYAVAGALVRELAPSLARLLVPGGIWIVESDMDTDALAEARSVCGDDIWDEWRTKDYGQTRLAMLRRQG
jgi:16S rRNA (guanine966-N2)-methyltransferase